MPYGEIKDMANHDNSLKPLTFNPKKIQRIYFFLKYLLLLDLKLFFFFKCQFLAKWYETLP